MDVQGGEEDVYATLLTTDTYLPGALVLAHSLRDAGTSRKLAVLVTRDTVSAEVVDQLKTAYDYVLPVGRIRNETDPAKLGLMNRPDLHSAFTKIHLWRQTQFRRIVYLDADVVAYRAPDELFDLPHAFAAAPDIGWPDLFNTGVMALTPNLADYYALVAMAERGVSFDGADQGLLNMYFKDDYHRLSFTYNVTPSAHYQYVPAYRHFQSSINMVHFIGAEKPWLQGRPGAAGDSPFGEIVARWWAVYDRHYKRPSPQAAPSEPGQPETARRPPELVQYFVKGEYQPTTAYVVPTGEPGTAPGATQGQHHQQPPTHSSLASSHYHYPPQQHPAAPPPSHPPPAHGEDHHHHQDPPQSGDAPRSSAQSAPRPSASSSASFSESFHNAQGAQAEAREEQVPSPPHPEPERKPEPPPLQETWDAQRQAPPPDSRPEAFNFPQAHYEMSSDTAPFVPPRRYPSPPRNMWYELPKEKPAPPTKKPRPIFPWESHQSRPSRVFADETPEPNVTEEVSPEHSGPSSAEQKSESATTPTTPSVREAPSDPWSNFTRVNAWDDVPQIEKYVDALPWHRRTKSQGTSTGLATPGTEAGFGRMRAQFQNAAPWPGFGSKLTDFPSEVDRPSLPVTPAPVRRSTLWGGGGPGDGGGGDDEQLPAAEGVPAQSDWDPVAQLQKLAKQQSELLLQKLGAVSSGGGGGGTVGGGEAGEGSSRAAGEIPPASSSAAQPATVLSPRPVKPGQVPRSLLGGEQPPSSADQSAAAAASSSSSSSTIPEPSYHGPGLAWEKDEGYLEHSSALPPTEEEEDVLET